MEINEMRELKRKLNQDIANKVTEFSNATGLVVTCVNLTTVSRFGIGEPIYEVKVEVKL